MVRLENVVHNSLSGTVRDHVECQIHNEQVDIACRVGNG